MIETVTSADGTTIAYERTGSGQPLIVIGGAFNTRYSAFGLRQQLEPHFTVYVYDRRGRGDSGDTQPYLVEDEVEDLGALIEAAGGSALVYGHSSGAILALEAASRGLPIVRLAAYEPPYTADPASPGPVSDGGVQAALDAGDREGAAIAFMRLTGADDEAIAGISSAPFWPSMLAIAHTLPYDLTLCGDTTVPSERFSVITVPTLVIEGGDSPVWAARAADAVAAAIPNGTRATLPGQNHNVDDAALAPMLVEFFEQR